ncbi:MAG: ABC transporter ATP-binding protein [Chthonomonadales bacterium]
MGSMIDIRHLRKEYKDLVALKDLNLTLEAGDIFGFIGPNGAGKTTTIKMLATLLTPTSGVALVNGIDVVQDPEGVRSLVGYMPDFFGVYDDMKVWEYLDFFAAAYRIPRSDRPQIIDDVLTLTDLVVKKDAYVESLSRGMKQRLCLAKTLVHDPKILLLDEPASGLDPRARIEIKELLKELKAMGKTIIISSHILPELADFCNKIGIIEKGQMIVAGDVKEIIRQVSGHHLLEAKLVDEVNEELESLDISSLASQTGTEGGVHARVSAEVDRAVAILNAREDVEDAKYQDGVILIPYTGEPSMEWAVLSDLVAQGIRIRSFGPQATDLEDVFMRVTKGIVN